MPLPNLIPAGGQVQVQNTTFSVDALGRYVCSTWDEATANGGAPFSAIVVGAGMYGAYCAAKIFRRHPSKRVLLLDAGRFLVSEHVQNLARIGLNVPSPIRSVERSGRGARARVGHPLARQRGVSRARLLHRRQVDLLGRVVSAAHRRRPAGLAGCSSAVSRTRTTLNVESETGVVPGTDFIFGDLLNVLRNEIGSAVGFLPNIETTIGNNGVEVGPVGRPRQSRRARACSASTSTAACRSWSKRSATPSHSPAGTTRTAGFSWCRWRMSSSCTPPAAWCTRSRWMSAANASFCPSARSAR